MWHLIVSIPGHLYYNIIQCDFNAKLKVKGKRFFLVNISPKP